MDFTLGKFLEIEKKYNLYSLTAGGVNYWMYYRFAFWINVICKQKLGVSEKHNKKVYNLTGRFLALYKLLYCSLTKTNRKIKNRDVCFIAHERRVKTKGFYECIYTEEIARQYNGAVTLEKPYGYEHLLPIKEQDIIYLDNVLVAGHLYGSFHKYLKTKKYKTLKQEVSKQLDGALNEIRNAYECLFSLDTICNKIVDIILETQIERKKCEQLLQRLQPKLIVEVVHYSKLCMVMNELSKQRGIQTVELQHGTISSEHLPYQYNSDIELAQLPTYVFTFSEYWSHVIKMPIDTDKIIAVGYPFFEKKKASVKTESIKLLEKARKKTILFISQWTIGQQLSQLAAELRNRLPKEDYDIIYKLHPGEFSIWRKKYVELAGSDVLVIGENDIGIYECFAISDVQVGVYSTAIYEGLGFGLTTYIYNTSYADTMKLLTEYGAAKRVDSVDDLANDILYDTGNVKNISELIWKTNAFQNICNELDRLLYK